MIFHAHVNSRCSFSTAVDVARAGHPPELNFLLDPNKGATRITTAGINASFASSANGNFWYFSRFVRSLAGVAFDVREGDDFLDVAVLAAAGDDTPTGGDEGGVVSELAGWQADRSDEI